MGLEKTMKKWFLSLMLIAALLAACTAPQEAESIPVVAERPSATVETVVPTETHAPSATPTETPIPPTPTPIATPTPVPPKAWVDPALPGDMRSLIESALDPLGVLYTQTPDQADVRVANDLPHTAIHYTYALVVPFPTLADDVSWDEVRRFWAGEEGALTAISRTSQTPTLYISADDLAMMQLLLGEPADGASIEVVARGELIDSAWNARPLAWSIVPFDRLTPQWKVLHIDGINVLERELDAYPLSIRIGAEGPAADEFLAALLSDGQPLINRDESRMTNLIMTGVTAMVRAMAHEMEVRGVLYPAEHVGPLLRSGDITHISNEIPFAANCPPPNRASKSLVFCSDPKYIELMREVGTDVVELTGNHFQDYGSEATLMTLEMYKAEGWPYFGGGANLEEARRPITMTHNGNTFSFIGCNPVGPPYAWATEDRPGAAPCDYEYMHAELERLAGEVDVPVVTWQYWEFYHYAPTPQQKEDFRAMVNAGAKIVSGSQAHHPQALEFYDGAFIHYGLGNLFFDQMWSLGTRQIVIDRHTIHRGQHISTELFTFMLENWSQPRPTTTQEREQLLIAVFGASNW
jgi:hypothetical protein